jgi:RNA polymerase sigma-70 factor, ECF subfamily
MTRCAQADASLLGSTPRCDQNVKTLTVRPCPVDTLLNGTDDSAIAIAIARGQDDVMKILVETYGGAVFRIARRLLVDEGEAEDLCQRVYLEIYRDIKKFDPRRGSLRSWLLTRAFHRSLNRRKHLEAMGFYRSKAGPEDEIAEPASTGSRTRFNLLPHELRHLAAQLLLALTPADRELIMLTFYQRLTREEAAAHLGTTVAAVRHSLQRALKIMKSLLLSSTTAQNGTEKDIHVR